MDYREEHGKESLATQYKEQRSCLEDALFHCLRAQGAHTTPQTIREMGDTPFHVAQEWVKSQYDLSLVRVSSNFNLKGGPELALSGLYVVQLLVTTDKITTQIQNTTAFSIMGWTLSIIQERRRFCKSKRVIGNQLLLHVLCSRPITHLTSKFVSRMYTSLFK